MQAPTARARASWQHHSQFGQDTLVGDVLFRGRAGFFVDVGARDGTLNSNTHYLEQRLGWTGIALEPHPDLFETLRETRSCQCLNVAAGRASDTLEFVKFLDPPLGNSGLLATFRRPERLRDIRHEIVSVQVEPLSKLLAGIDLVHYLDIDVEGHELAVLQGTDFSRVEFRIIGIEAGLDQQAIDDFLADKGFRPFLQLRADRFYCQGSDVPSARRLFELP